MAACKTMSIWIQTMLSQYSQRQGLSQRLYYMGLTFGGDPIFKKTGN